MSEWMKLVILEFRKQTPTIYFHIYLRLGKVAWFIFTNSKLISPDVIYCVIFSCRSKMTQSRLFMMFVESSMKNKIKFKKKKHNWRYYQIQKVYACIYISKITSLSFYHTTILRTTSQRKIESQKNLSVFSIHWYIRVRLRQRIFCTNIYIIWCHPIVYRWNFRDNISLAAGGW